MMLNDTAINNLKELSHLIKCIPYKYHFRIHHIHNVEFRTSWSLPEKTVDEFILAYIREGNGHYVINGETIPFETGHMYLISPDSVFSATEYDLTPSLISIRFGLFDNATREWVQIAKPFHLHYDTMKAEKYRDFFYDTYSVYLAGDDVATQNGMLSLITSQLLKDLQNNTSKNASDLRLESARVYVEKHIEQDLTVEELANIARLSAPYFSKQFKKQYGMSPKSYIFHARMRYAKILLSEYHYSVNETADALHYSDMFIFSNQYKKHWGHPPSKARELKL